MISSIATLFVFPLVGWLNLYLIAAILLLAGETKFILNLRIELIYNGVTIFFIKPVLR